MYAVHGCIQVTCRQCIGAYKCIGAVHRCIQPTSMFATCRHCIGAYKCIGAFLKVEKIGFLLTVIRRLLGYFLIIETVNNSPVANRNPVGSVGTVGTGRSI